MDNSYIKYELLINGQSFGSVLLSEANGGLWSATCLYTDREKRMLKAVGQEGSSTVQNKIVAGTSKAEVLEKLTTWAEDEFGNDVELKPAE